MAKMFDIEKRTQLLLGLLGLVVALALIPISLGKSDWAMVMGIVASFFVGLFLLSEGAILTYFNRSEFRRITFSDIIVWFSFGIGLLIIAQGILLISIIGEAIPRTLETFLSVHGVTISILAGLLFLFHMFTPRPK